MSLADKLDFVFAYQAWAAEQQTGTPDVSANAYGEHLKAIAAVEAIEEIGRVLRRTSPRADQGDGDVTSAAAIQNIRDIINGFEEPA